MSHPATDLVLLRPSPEMQNGPSLESNGGLLEPITNTINARVGAVAPLDTVEYRSQIVPNVGP